MVRSLKSVFAIVFSLLIIFSACKKIEEFREDPNIEPLKQGFKTSAAISYCSSLALMAFQGEELPSHVTLSSGSTTGYSRSIVLTISTDTDSSLPFNSHIGEVLIAGIWDEVGESGVISIIFGNLDIFNGEFKFYGLHTVPLKRKLNSERYITAFAQQDIVVGQGSDTLLHVGLSKIQFDTELDRLDQEPPTNTFVAAQQNIWFIQFYQNDPADLLDDDYELSGGGQIVAATDNSGGITYHAFIEADYGFGDCDLNPTSGSGFIQNIRAGDEVDLGHISLDFHSTCDGKADVEFATGKYVGSNGRAINLHFN